MTGKVLSSARHEIQITYRNNIGRYLFLLAAAVGCVWLWGVGN